MIALVYLGGQICAPVEFVLANHRVHVSFYDYNAWLMRKKRNCVPVWYMIYNLSKLCFTLKQCLEGYSALWGYCGLFHTLHFSSLMWNKRKHFYRTNYTGNKTSANTHHPSVTIMKDFPNVKDTGLTCQLSVKVSRSLWMTGASPGNLKASK